MEVLNTRWKTSELISPGFRMISKSQQLSGSQGSHWIAPEVFKARYNFFFLLFFKSVNSLSKVRFTSILNQRMLFNVSDQCTSVVSRDNETLEMRQANCSFPKIGICINTSCEYKSIVKISFSVH